MFYCPDCGYEFEKSKNLYETHGLDTPPFERLSVCPFCNSPHFYEKVTAHCRCCGIKISSDQNGYCSKKCKEKGEFLRAKERRRKNLKINSPINIILRELEMYNQVHKTNYSYGQYVAIIKPKLEKLKKCKKKRKNT